MRLFSALLAFLVLAFFVLFSCIGQRLTSAEVIGRCRIVELLYRSSLSHLGRRFVPVDLQNGYWCECLPIVSEDAYGILAHYARFHFHSMWTGSITVHGTGSVGTVAPSCLHTIPQSNHCTIALAHPRTAQVSRKCSIISFLYFFSFPKFYQQSQYFSVSAFLRESIARFILSYLVTTLSCSFSSFFLSLRRFIRLSLRRFRPFNLFHTSVPSSLRLSIYPFLRLFIL